MSVKRGPAEATGPASASPQPIAPPELQWHWSMAPFWQQMIASQQQWLLEWWLGLLSGALRPARAIRGVSPGGRQHVGLARRQLGCVGAADLADLGSPIGEPSPVADDSAVPVGTSAPGGGRGRRSRRPPKAGPR